MGHFISKQGQNLYVDEDGRAWDTELKRLEYSPETFQPLDVTPQDITPEPIVAEIIEPDSSKMEQELEAMDYQELLELADMKRGTGASRTKAIAKILGA